MASRRSPAKPFAIKSPTAEQGSTEKQRTLWVRFVICRLPSVELPLWRVGLDVTRSCSVASQSSTDCIYRDTIHMIRQTNPSFPNRGNGQASADSDHESCRAPIPNAQRLEVHLTFMPRRSRRLIGPRLPMEIGTSSKCAVLRVTERVVVSEDDAGNHGVAQVTGPALLLSVASVRSPVPPPRCSWA